MRRTDSATADELLAEVFAICWRRIEEVPSDPLPWLFEVSRRVLSTQRRGARRRAALQARLRAITPDRSDDPAAVTRESPLRSALEQLSDADRELLTLVAWDGLSPAQAASALGVKPGTLRVRLARARARLAKQLERDEPTPTLRQRPMETP
jgi:RNA polymerase sigma-70 factor (ECF subfamily)